MTETSFFWLNCASPQYKGGNPAICSCVAVLLLFLMESIEHGYLQGIGNRIINWHRVSCTEHALFGLRDIITDAEGNWMTTSWFTNCVM